MSELNNSELIANEHDEKTALERYVYLEERQGIIYELRLM